MAGRLHILDLLRLLRDAKAILERASDLLTLPDLSDPEAVYAWCRKVVAVANSLAVITPNTYDDKVVIFLNTHVFSSYEAFKPWYDVFRVIIALLHSEDDDAIVADKALYYANESVRDELAAVEAGVDPVTILSVVVTLIRLIVRVLK